MKAIRVLYLLSALALCSPGSAQSTNEIRYDLDPPQQVLVKYRLFKVSNIHNQLLLDTSTGRVWQVQHALEEKNRMTIPINTKPLLRQGESPRIGRFTIYYTKNIYNVLILDQDTGRTFMCQWSTDGKEGIVPIEPFPEDEKKG